MPKQGRKSGGKTTDHGKGASENVSLTDRATRTVRDSILNLTLTPGMTLDERYLVERFELGRTPMREAMNRLIVEGLVVSRGARGIQVAPLDIDTSIELFDAYVLSERMVASVLNFKNPGLVKDLKKLHGIYISNLDGTNLLKVTELNALFHARMADATQNNHIAAYSHQLHNLARRLSYFIYKREASSDNAINAMLFDKPLHDHELIIEAIENSDRDVFVHILTAHAMFFRKRLAKLITENRGNEIDLTGITEFAEIA